MEKTLKTQSYKVKMMTRIAILTAIGTILYKIEIPIMVSHLKIDPSLIPSLIGGIIMGPIAGITIELLKNLIDLMSTTSAGIGQLINFLVGSSVIVPVCLVYRAKQTKLSYIIGAIISMVCIISIGALLNYLLTPLFLSVIGRPEPSHAEIMGYVIASLTLNSLKGIVTLVPTFFIIPILKEHSM